MRLRKAVFSSAASLLLLIYVVVLSLSSFGLADDSTKLGHNLSLRLSGGLGFVTVGDMNTSFREWALTLPSRTTTDTELRAMMIDRWSMTWEAELRFDLSKKIALGIALSNPLSQTKITSFPLYDPASDDPTPVGAFASDATVDVRSPIRISAYYTLPLSPKTNLLFGMGIGYYSGRMQEALDLEYFADWHRSAWQTEWVSALGFHGGVSFEYLLSKRFSMILDAQLRRAVLTNFPATMDLDTNMVPTGFYFDQSGTLYLARWDEYWPMGVGTQEFYVWMTEPIGPVGGMFGARSQGKAVLDLSGLSFTFGIRISLF
jgi:hypothetical protein